MATTKKQNLLKTLWTMAEKELADAKMNKASKRLQRQAEIEVGNKVDAVDKAQELLDLAIQESLNTAEFAKIDLASLNLLKAEKELENSVAIYEKIFEEKPKLV